MKLDPNTQQQDEPLESSVEVSSPQFKMKLEDINWKVVIVVGMILASIVYIIKG